MNEGTRGAPKPAARRRRAPSPGRRAANKEKTRERILHAALDLFRERGFERTTTRQISTRAGIAEGTLFNYFKTKEDLALYFFHKETDAIIRDFKKDSRLRSASLGEKLFAIIHRQLESIAPYEDFIGGVIFRSLQPRSKLSPLSLESQELRLRYLMFIREVLASAEENGEIPPVGILGAYATGLFYVGVVAHWLQDSSPQKQKTVALLDRGLNTATRLLKKGGWEW